MSILTGLKFYEKEKGNLIEYYSNQKFINELIFEKKQDLFNVLSDEQKKEIGSSNKLISQLNIRISEEDLLKYTFKIKMGDNVFNQKVFDLGSTEKKEKFDELNFVTYYKLESLDEVIEHKIICVGSNKHFENNIFSHVIGDYYKTDDGFKLTTLEEDGNFKDGKFLKYNVFSEHSGSCSASSSIKKPKQRKYKFFSRNVLPYLNPGIQDLIIEGIEDGSFEIPFMIETEV